MRGSIFTGIGQSFGGMLVAEIAAHFSSLFTKLAQRGSPGNCRVELSCSSAPLA